VTYHEEALRVITDSELPSSYRHVFRLANFYDTLHRAGREDRAVQVLDELKAVAARLPDDPRVARALNQATSGAAFHSGARTQEVLDGLLAACRAYEEARGQARGLDLAGFAQALDPPYDEAAQVALALGDAALALGVLERGTARTLLDVIHAAAPAGPPDWNMVPDIGGDFGISLLPTGETITLLALDGDGGAITQAEVEDGDPPLWRSLRAFTDSADSERQSLDNASALDTVLAHATFRRLAEAIARLTPPGRRTWLVPHGYLHNAPLQLLPAPAARYAIMPSVTVAASLPVERPFTERTGIVVFGDSLGDLPFARAEARLIAGGHRAVAIGSECTLDRLRSEVSGPAGTVHIACHGRFDWLRPDRSGLLLAAPPDEQLAGTAAARLLVLPEVAQLPLDGKVVVLSACSSGMESVRASEPTGLVTALLEAGASTVIAAQWFINDLSAMLLMTRFYEELARQPDTGGLLATLDSAAAGVRDMSAAGLIEHGFEIADRLLALGATTTEASRVAGRCLSYAFSVVGDQDSAELAHRVATADVTETGANGDRLAALRGLRPSPGLGAGEFPFAHPRHWGPFKIVGRVAGQGRVAVTGG
jgi:CHAT domain-containing protein